MSAGRGPESTRLNDQLNALATLARHLSPKALEAVKPPLALNPKEQPSEGRTRQPEQTPNPQEK